MREASTSTSREDLEHEEASMNGCWRKEKIGFWCPADIELAIQKLVDQGAYQDKSKACVDLIRKGLKNAVPMELSQRLEELSRVLLRDPEVIASQCIQGMFELIDTDANQVPLIVEEIRLRERRRKAFKKASKIVDDPQI
ncbi:hypothetical protein [Verrucomicrobium sp. GAS474]|uniref:hypothetical protein n=1 Tax=Verrucomicrobium sp. GAS474 TaxID=1882831 RepID=UPI0012FFD1EE|nr:hypothetical protein [Verrucomicrobium sp. GAS474]